MSLEADNVSEVNNMIIDLLKTPNSKLNFPLQNDTIEIIEKHKFNSFIIEKLNSSSITLLTNNVPTEFLNATTYSLELTIDNFSDPEINKLIIESARIIFKFNKGMVHSLNHMVLYILMGCDITPLNQFEFEYNELCLLLAYKTHNLKNINFILEKKVFPNEKCFDVFLKSSNEGLSKYEENKEQSILMTLAQYGYKFTYSDLIKIMDSCIFINPDDYEIKIDCNFYNKCLELTYKGTTDYIMRQIAKQYTDYITKKFPLIKPDISVLQTACKYANTPIVKILLKKYKLNPDEKCMEEACTSTKSLAVLGLLIESGLKPNKTCVLNMLRAFDNKPAALIADNY
jgi:hypothetical protein